MLIDLGCPWILRLSILHHKDLIPIQERKQDIQDLFQLKRRASQRLHLEIMLTKK